MYIPSPFSPPHKAQHRIRSELVEHILPGLKRLQTLSVDLPPQGAEFALKPDSKDNPRRILLSNFFTEVGLPTALYRSEGNEIRLYPAKIPIFYLLLLMHLRLGLIDSDSDIALTVQGALDEETLFLLTPLLFGKGLIPKGDLSFDGPIPGEAVSIANAYKSYIGQTLDPEGRVLKEETQTYFSLIAPAWIPYLIERMAQRKGELPSETQWTAENLLMEMLQFQTEWLAYGSLAAFQILGKQEERGGMKSAYQAIKGGFFSFYSGLKEEGENFFITSTNASQVFWNFLSFLIACI